MALQDRYRRPAERRQVDPVQRADPDRSGAGGELSVLHHRAERRRRGRARRRGSTGWPVIASSEKIIPAPHQLRRHRRPRARRLARARASATSSSPTSASATPSPTSLRCFEDADVIHVEGRVDPLADIETVETELMLADLETLEKRLAKLQRKRKGGDKEARRPGAAARGGARSTRTPASRRARVKVAEPRTSGPGACCSS